MAFVITLIIGAAAYLAYRSSKVIVIGAGKDGLPLILDTK